MDGHRNSAPQGTVTPTTVLSTATSAHMSVLRSGLDAARTALGIGTSAYTDDTLVAARLRSRLRTSTSFEQGWSNSWSAGFRMASLKNRRPEGRRSTQGQCS